MEKFNIPEPNTSTKPTADITLKQDESGIVQTESFPVIPKEYNLNDFNRPVKMSDLNKIYLEAEKINNSTFQWDELAIGISTLGFGATLSALLADVKLDTDLGKLFYIALPIISVALAVFVVMYKILRQKTSKYSSQQISSIVSEYLDKKELENINESK